MTGKRQRTAPPSLQQKMLHRAWYKPVAPCLPQKLPSAAVQGSRKSRQQNRSTARTKRAMRPHTKAGAAVTRSDAQAAVPDYHQYPSRSEEHPSELQSLMRISYAVFCLIKKNTTALIFTEHTTTN